MKKEPLQVYLDNKDYSDMANRDQGNAKQEFGEVYEYLLKRVNQGDIKIRISNFNVAELMPASIEYKDAGLRRAITAKALCQSNALIYHEDLIVESMIQICERRIKNRGGPFLKEIAYSDTGKWAPNLVSEEFDFRNEIKEVVFGIIEQRFPVEREANKRKKRAITSNGFLSTQAGSMISPESIFVINMMRERFPIGERIYRENMILGYATGRVSIDELAAEIQKGFCDLENLAGWIYEKYDQARDINSIYRRPGSALKSSIEDVRERFGEVFKKCKDAGIPSKDIVKKAKSGFNWIEPRKRIVNHIIRTNRKKFNKYGGINPSFAAISGSEIGEIHFLDQSHEVMIQFSADRALQTSMPSKLEPSDYTDSMQVGYIPFVDVFSCDVRTEQFVRKVAKRYETSIAKKLIEIPDVIENALSEKNT